MIQHPQGDPPTAVGFDLTPNHREERFNPAFDISQVVATIAGAIGFGCDIEPFESLPYLGGDRLSVHGTNALSTPEISLYWEIGRAYRRQGYATETAQALIDYAFNVMRVKRVFALTHPDNAGSLGVMRKLGMYIERAHCTEAEASAGFAVHHATKTGLKPRRPVSPIAPYRLRVYI